MVISTYMGKPVEITTTQAPNRIDFIRGVCVMHPSTAALLAANVPNK
jgi:hypothetical protein